MFKEVREGSARAGRLLAALIASALLVAGPAFAQSLPPPDVASTSSIGPLLDYRIGPLDKLIGADNRVGLSNVLTGAADLSEVIQAGRLTNLYLVTSGPLPPNPAELLASGRLMLFVAEAQRLFDLVIFDGPPIMGLADAPLVSAAVGGTVMVLEAGLTGRSQARAALRRLAMARGHLLGAVLTKFNAKAASYGYGYGYQYDYDYGRPAAAGAARGILSRWRAPRVAARQ